ncbi:MAG TPA: hypothetical protein VEX60_00665 [Pyrinomonadaceae bacterium]|nr:hypothetical protein [Pyrinomonadaceae bacterium]
MDNAKIQSRFIVDLPCAFGATLGTPRNGTITSIGLKGCFVKTTVTVAQEQALFVRVWTNQDRWLRLHGTVKYHMDRVGFGLTFGELAEGDINDLAALIEELRRQNRIAPPARQGEEVEA